MKFASIEMMLQTFIEQGIHEDLQHRHRAHSLASTRASCRISKQSSGGWLPPSCPEMKKLGIQRRLMPGELKADWNESHRR
jgi:hypothetical protein